MSLKNAKARLKILNNKSKEICLDKEKINMQLN